MADVMLQLGEYQFSLDTAAYDNLRRSARYLWAEQQRIGLNPSLQFVGKAAETISLSGSILPQFKGGLSQLNNMRSSADKGEPLLLVAGTGDVLGRWVISSVNEAQSIHMGDGVARKIDFDMEIKYYGANI